MLEKEFKFYRSNQTELVEKYNNKFIVIKDEKVIGVYESHADAYNNSVEQHEPGTFLIQHCMAGTEGYTQTFHSRVIINKLSTWK